MTDPVFLTPEGLAKIQQELDNLVNVRRPELAVKLAEAVSMGDLKENADYHDAKEQQALVEGRIQYLENLLRSAVVVDNGGVTDQVQIGSTVRIRFLDDGSEEVYKIVGAAEANPKEGRISNVSPIGSALMGKKRNAKVSVQTPGGSAEIKILSIE
ncbi:MAG: transcription elongation factor GreA [Candidatus Flexifilum sp.]|jgi:transcription elongation factor GreA